LVLSYIQEGLADIWKENIMEDLERGLLNYKVVGEFLADLKEEFGEGDKEAIKIAELRRLEQGCYDSMLKVLSKELTLVLSDTRELDRVPSTK